MVGLTGFEPGAGNELEQVHGASRKASFPRYAMPMRTLDVRPIERRGGLTTVACGKTIYVVSHPEASHHCEGLVGGWYDSDLTAQGLADAESIARRLCQQIDAGVGAEIFSSDSLRARRTAEQISHVIGSAVILDERLREKSYGTAEGRPQSWLEARFVPPPAVGDRLNHDEGIPGAETRGAFAARVYAAMDTIAARPAECQVVVTHGFTLTFVIAAWIHMPPESLGYVNFRSKPGSITTLRQDEYFHNRQVVALAETCHLDAPHQDHPDVFTHRDKT